VPSASSLARPDRKQGSASRTVDSELALYPIRGKRDEVGRMFMSGYPSAAVLGRNGGCGCRVPGIEDCSLDVFSVGSEMPVRRVDRRERPDRTRQREQRNAGADRTRRVRVA